MTDEHKPAVRVDAPLRAVLRGAGLDKMYYVYEYKQGYGYEKMQPERGYKHSTSCYAQLGRITNRENQAALAQFGN